MADVVRAPQEIGDEEVVLADWVVAEGEQFVTMAPLANLETAKALLEVEAEADGVMLRHLVAAGGTVSAGAPLALVGVAGETLDDHQLAELLGGQPLRPPQQPPTALQPVRVMASPLARRLAQEAKLDLAEVSGTGPGGRIRRADIERALAAQREPAASTEAAVAAAAPVRAGTYTAVPHSTMRRAIARRLSESKSTIPHFYVEGTARVDRLLELRAEVASLTSSRVTLTDFLLKAVARAHLAVPAVNVLWTDAEIRQFHTVDVALAVATDRGLVAPVLRGVESLSIAAIAARRAELVGRARDGRVTPSELDGGTVALSNLGGSGVERFAAIINPPHSSILAVGSAAVEPVVTDGQLAVGTVLHLTLSADHRPIDGAVAAAWMRVFVASVEAPTSLLL